MKAWHVVSGWAALVATSIPICMQSQASSASVYDFFWTDHVTRCFSLLNERFPRAFLDTRTIALIASGQDALDAYETARTIPLNEQNETLREVCGFCATLAFADGNAREPSAAWMMALTVAAPVPDSQVLIIIRVPDSTTDVFTDRLAAYAQDHNVLYITQSQMQRDVRTSGKTDNWRGNIGLLLVSACVYFGFRQSRSRHPFRLMLCTYLSLLAVLVLATSVSTALNIKLSVFSVVVAPMVIGIGVDSLLIILNACNQQKERDVEAAMARCSPAMIASTFTTCIGFVVGSFVPIPNIENLCRQCIVFFAVSGFAQLTLFPAIVHLTGLRRSPRHVKFNLLPFTALALALLPLTPLGLISPPDFEDSVLVNLNAELMTSRAITRMYDAFGGALTITYAYMEPNATEWAETEAALDVLPQADLLSWHRVYNLSADITVNEWMDNTLNAAVFGDFVNVHTHESVLVTRTLFPLNTTVHSKHKTAKALAGRQAHGACIFNSELLAAYTLIELAGVTAVVAALISAICVLIGVVSVGRRCVLACVTLGLTATSILGAMRLVAFRVDMIVLVAFLVTPGIVTDYALHLAHDGSNGFAVCIGALTSISSLVPFVTVPVTGVRHFMIVYIIAIASGCIFSLSIVPSGAFPWCNKYTAV